MINYTYSVNTPLPSEEDIPHPSLQHHHPAGPQHDTHGLLAVPSSPSAVISVPQEILQTDIVLPHWKVHGVTHL